MNVYQTARYYIGGKAARIGASVFVVVAPVLGGCAGVKYFMDGVNGEVEKFCTNTAKLADIAHNQPTIDQLLRDPNTTAQDVINKAGAFPISLIVDPAYFLAKFAQDPNINTTLEQAIIYAVRNPVETTARGVSYGVLGKAIHDAQGHGGKGAAGNGTPKPPFPNPNPGGGGGPGWGGN